MSDPFDPYHQWLGIPPKKQPPNHYTLLGLAAFESNPDVIENAADQRMAHLRTLQSGKRGELSQRLLNEVSAARLCLLDPAEKAAYDNQLRDKVEAAGEKGHLVSDDPRPTSNLTGLTSSSMLFDHREFWLPKDEGRPEQFEDAWAVNPLASVAAVADGGSSSLFAGTWARLLVDAAVEDPSNIVHDDGLAKLRQAWRDPIDVDSLASHEQPRVAEGASSTLLMVQLSVTERDGAEAAGRIRFSACAAGDCCLFHVRGDQVLRVFPYNESRLFQEDPQVIRSVDCRPHREIRFETLEEDCGPDDLIVLCTGAIAAWALVQLEAGHSPNWQHCWDLSQHAWSEHVRRLREQGLIRVADSTVLLLKVAQHRQTNLSEQRNLKSDWQDDFKQTIDVLTRQGKKALEDLKEQGQKAIDWLTSSDRDKK